MPSIATLVRRGPHGESLYRITPPLEGTTDHVLISFSGEAEETAIFPAKANGKPVSYRDLASIRGHVPDRTMLASIDYTIQEA